MTKTYTIKEWFPSHTLPTKKALEIKDMVTKRLHIYDLVLDSGTTKTWIWKKKKTLSNNDTE